MVSLEFIRSDGNSYEVSLMRGTPEFINAAKAQGQPVFSVRDASQDANGNKSNETSGLAGIGVTFHLDSDTGLISVKSMVPGGAADRSQSVRSDFPSPLSMPAISLDLTACAVSRLCRD